MWQLILLHAAQRQIGSKHMKFKKMLCTYYTHARTHEGGKWGGMRGSKIEI
jgi:hypothetical protein